MIPAHRPAYVARYRHHNKTTDTTHHTTKPVVAWDDDKTALVADEKTGRLVDADSYSNFAGVMEADTPTVATIPGGGWLAEYRDDDGTLWTRAVLAWNAKADGDLTPVCMDPDGLAGEPFGDHGFVRLYHPDEYTPSPKQDD